MYARLDFRQESIFDKGQFAISAVFSFSLLPSFQFQLRIAKLAFCTSRLLAFFSPTSLQFTLLLHAPRDLKHSMSRINRVTQPIFETRYSNEDLSLSLSLSRSRNAGNESEVENYAARRVRGRPALEGLTQCVP